MEKKMRISNLAPRGLRGALLAGLLGTTMLTGFAVGHSGLADTSQPAPIRPTAPAQPLPDFTALVSRVLPAVVSVTTELNTEAADEESGVPTPFGRLPFPFGMMPQQRQAVEARGSGFIIDPDGVIVTNNHVVKNAKSVSVTLNDGTELPARIVGRDPRTDLAVLRVNAGHKLPYVQLGNSDDVKVGEWVVAVGNPFGLGGTVTAGIVSARGREIGAGPYDDFLQIDAPINRGNSGGPLFTQDGRVVGVNTAILSPSGGSIGIGFAIPSNIVKTVVAQLEQTGHVTRGYLGVEAQQITPDMAAALNLPKTNLAHAGALIAQVEPDSPAAKVGLKPGDVITGVNGKAIGNPRDLALAIAAVKPGDEARLDVLQNGETKTVTVAVATLPSSEDEAGPGMPGAEQEGVGLALAPLSPEMRQQLDLPQHLKGAAVVDVKPGSPADKAGLQQGDVIVGVGTEPVTSAEQAARAIRAAARKNHAVALRVFRDGHTEFVAINVKKGGGNAG
jgi:serine protease Do